MVKVFLFLFFIFAISVFLSLILYLVHFLLSSGTINFMPPIESGFLGKGSVNTHYSLYFFQLLLIFVIFDLEIVFLWFFLYNSFWGLTLFFIFMIFIFFTYYLEVYMSQINWSI